MAYGVSTISGVEECMGETMQSCLMQNQTKPKATKIHIQIKCYLRGKHHPEAELWKLS